MEQNYTEFGKFYTKLRKNRKQTMETAAKILGVSKAYISSVEHGKRELPIEWEQKIKGNYELTIEETNELETAVKNTPRDFHLKKSEVIAALTNFMLNCAETEEEKKYLNKIISKFDEMSFPPKK